MAACGWIGSIHHWHDASGWAAGKAGLPSIISISGTLLVIGGIAALILPKLPIGDVAHNGVRPPIVRDWALLLRLAVYRRVLIIAALVEGVTPCTMRSR